MAEKTDDAKSLYLGIGIDRERCAACAAYPSIPCAVHQEPSDG